MAPKTASKSHSVSSFYYTWFTIIDPILTLFGVSFGFLHETALKNMTATPVLPPAAETVYLMRSMGAFFVVLFILQVGRTSISL